jgi:F-type H+-transporting ATPase subunit delta
VIQNTIAKRYARALMLVAEERKQIDPYGNQLRAFAEACASNKDLLATLSNRFIDLDSRQKVLNSVSSKMDLNQDVGNFLKVLLKKGRFELFMQVYDEYLTMANKAMGRMPMKITSATDLQPQQYSDLVDFFGKKTGKEMIVQKSIDKSVLGGVQVQIGDQIYDYTLRGQLDALKDKMLQN